jgi:hypothetical protein
MHHDFVRLAGDVPYVDVLHLESPTTFSSLGAKDVGESGTIAVPVAIMNAAQNALGPGATQTEVLLPAEYMLRAISRRGLANTSDGREAVSTESRDASCLAKGTEI